MSLFRWLFRRGEPGEAKPSCRRLTPVYVHIDEDEAVCEDKRYS